MRRHSLLSLVLALVSFACAAPPAEEPVDAGTTRDAGTPERTLQSISITPSTFALEIGQTQALAVTATWSDATAGALAEGVTWESSDASVATVSAAGLVTAKAAGAVTITARAQGLSALSQGVLSAPVPPNDTLVVFDDDYRQGVVFETEFFANAEDWKTRITRDAAEKHAGSHSLKIHVIPADVALRGHFVAPEAKDLTKFTALTFWIKASKQVSGPFAGFGDYNEERRFYVQYLSYTVTTEWQKIVVPIADPTKPSAMRSIFDFIAFQDGEVDFWFDDIQYEQLPIGPASVVCMGPDTVAVGEIKTPSLFVHHMVDGKDVTTFAGFEGYFTFASSDAAVLKTDVNGGLEGVAPGLAHVTIKLAGVDALNPFANSAGVMNQPGLDITVVPATP